MILPLTPLAFLERSADVFPDRPAVITAIGYTQTYREFRAEARLVAEGLREMGAGTGARVAVLARNGPDALRMHYAVPGAGAVLVALNTRLAPAEYAYILQDSAADVLFVESALADRVSPIAGHLKCAIVELPDAQDRSVANRGLGLSYTEWLATVSDEGDGLTAPQYETDSIAINYTSGTTGRPKGAVYTHRGAYLNALGVALEMQLDPGSRYLWTLPMFHCNGWCFTWAVTAVGGSHITLATFDPDMVLNLIERNHVTHLCGAPVILNELASRGSDSGRHFDHRVQFATGGAPPSPTTIAAMREVGVEVTHLYGLTETYGPSIICEMQPEWADLDAAKLATKIARQGVRTINVEAVRVVDTDFSDVPTDGTTMGEIIIRSNTVVDGYHGDPDPSSEAREEGWLRTGDIAVVHTDGYIEVRDRSKDIIISGGENVSSIEIENVLVAHPAVSEAAVVGTPHAKWGEVPVAFLTLKPGLDVSADDLVEYARSRLAHFKAPRVVVFGELPKTSTGKVRKFDLRERAKSLGVS